MRTDNSTLRGNSFASERGVTLIELLIFLVIISVALVALLSVFSLQVTHSVDPVARVKAMEKGQALLDEILSRKFDENTPTGGVPACDSVSGPACAGLVADGDFDDVSDYVNYVDPDSSYTATVQVTEAGNDLNIPNHQARLITVAVDVPGGDVVRLSAYRVNF
jgi:MSHA pilin protein MshD